MTPDPYAAATDSAERLAQLTGQPAHDVAVVLGSGWARAADEFTADAFTTDAFTTDAFTTDAFTTGAPGPAAEVPLADLGGFPRTTVPGHAGVIRSVRLGQLRVLVFLGRTHLYEGHPVATVVHGVRMAVAAGCKVIVLTNAAGGIRESYQVGQPVLISDHLNLTGRSPLSGDPPPDGYPSRFTDLTDLYSRRLRELALHADPGLPDGIYAALPGPHYETPAEIRMLRTLGADLVGMSTVLEAIAARHLGAEVLAISLVTNLAAGLAPSGLAPAGLAQPGHAPAGLDHAEVVAAGKAAAARVGALLAGILPGVLPGTA